MLAGLKSRNQNGKRYLRNLTVEGKYIKMDLICLFGLDATGSGLDPLQVCFEQANKTFGCRKSGKTRVGLSGYQLTIKILLELVNWVF
jgi:hypothetical protein